MLLELIGLPGSGKSTLRKSIVRAYPVLDGDRVFQSGTTLREMAALGPRPIARSIQHFRLWDPAHRRLAKSFLKQLHLHRSASAFVMEHGLIHGTWLFRFQGHSVPVIKPPWPVAMIVVPPSLARERIRQKPQRLGTTNRILGATEITGAAWQEAVATYDEIASVLQVHMYDNARRIQDTLAEIWTDFGVAFEGESRGAGLG